MFVLMVGTLNKGYEFRGPFTTYDNTRDWARSNVSGNDYLIQEIEPPFAEGDYVLAHANRTPYQAIVIGASRIVNGEPVLTVLNDRTGKKAEISVSDVTLLRKS